MSGHNHHTFVMWLGGRAQNCIKISRGYSWQPLILHMKVNISYDTFSASTILYLLSQCNTVVLLLYDDNIQVPGVSCPSPGADRHMMSPSPLHWLLCWLMADDARCYGRNFTTVCYKLPSLYITMLQVSLICHQRNWNVHGFTCNVLLIGVWLWY